MSNLRSAFLGRFRLLRLGDQLPGLSKPVHRAIARSLSAGNDSRHAPAEGPADYCCAAGFSSAFAAAARTSGHRSKKTSGLALVSLICSAGSFVLIPFGFVPGLSAGTWRGGDWLKTRFCEDRVWPRQG